MATRRGGSAPPPPPSGYQPYLSSSAMNAKIPANPPIHPDSALMISAANNWLLAGTASDAYKEWLEPYSHGTERGTYYRGDTSLLPQVTMYANANGWVGAGPFTMPMPSWAAAVQGPYANTGDSYIQIVDSVTGDVWETWRTTPPGYTPWTTSAPSTRWNCQGYRHWPGGTSTKGYVTTYTSAYPPGTSASKIQLPCGMLVPEDFADCWAGDPGTAVPHVVRMGSFCGSNGTVHPRFVAPAGGGDGTQPNGIPCGGRVQLDPSIDVATWPSINTRPEPWRSALKKFCRGLQQYGVMQIDSTGVPSGTVDAASTPSVAKGGDDYPAGYQWPWDAAGVGGGYQHAVPYDLMDNFRVIDWTQWTGA